MAEDTNKPQGADGQNAPHHTEVAPPAQGTPEAQGASGVAEAQKKFLSLLNERMRESEGLLILALNFPESRMAATQSYGAKWRQDSRRCFTVVARVKRRMRADSAA
ncbi:hypothetical protein EBZ80_00855 [bacterium]|nr:hypothetical protein [bacterium]